MARHRRPSAPVSREKARKILHDREVRGHPLTARQRRFFGAIASGSPLRGSRVRGGTSERRAAARRRARSR